MSNLFFPPITKLLKPEQLPEELGFIQGGLATVLDKIFYRNFRVIHSSSGAFSSYELDIIATSELKFDIPGTGLALSLNPADMGQSGYSVIPINITYNLPIKQYIGNFKVQNFKFDAEAFYKQVVFKIVNIPDNSLVLMASSAFFEGENKLNQFAQQINQNHGTSIPAITVTNDAAINSILTAIGAINPHISIKDIILSDYILNDLGNLEKLLFYSFGENPLEAIKKLFIPKIAAKLSLFAGLEIPRDVLVPIKVNGDVETNENIKTTLVFSTEFTFVTDSKIGFGENLLVTFPASYPKAEIAGTGLTLGFTNAKLDLSRTTNIPEATADGRPDDFVGVFIQHAEIGLPKEWTPDPDTSNVKILGKNLIIGTGGLSGIIGLDSGGNLKLVFGNGFKVQFDYFDLVFNQNAITASNIAGKLTIPGFKRGNSDTEPAEIDIIAGVQKGGDFFITAKPIGGILIKIPNVFSYNMTSVSIGKQGDRYFLATSGSLKLQLGGGALSNLLPSEIQLDKFIIWSDGSFELSGGSLILREPIQLKIGTVTITVTAIHMGSYERNHGGRLRKYKYIGFDGGISINPGGIDARGDGIKLYFSVDDGPLDVFLRIQGIAVDIIIPGKANADTATAIIKGYLTMREPVPNDPDGSTEYIGGVDLTLPKLNLKAGADMRLSPATPAFIVDVSLELPTAIPLAATGLGIYGFRGIIGMRYALSKKAAGLTDADSWYDYYKAKVAPNYQEGVSVSKMHRKAGFALGAGLSLGTLDNGFTFSTKLLALFYNSGLMIEGKMAFLKQRVGLDTVNDPPLFILIAIDENAIESAAGVQFKIPQDSGAILDLSGSIEIKFFFNDSSAWYINVGRDFPEQKRIRAKVLSLFDANAYFMVSAKGIRTGANINLDYGKTFGPLKVVAKFWLSQSAKISFKPIQLGGFISAGGQAGLYVFSFGFSLSVAFYLGAEAPRPFAVKGSVTVSVGFKLFRKRREYGANIELSWIFNRDRDLSEQILLDFGRGVKAVNMLTGEGFPIKGLPFRINTLIPVEEVYTIPLDSYIDFQFEKSMGYAFNENLSSLITRFGIIQGANNEETIPPQPSGLTSPVKHSYFIDNITLSYWNGNIWAVYNPAQALIPVNVGEQHGYSPDNPGEMVGAWQWKGPLNNNLRIAAITPFDYQLQGSSIIPLDQLGVKESLLTCERDRIEQHCLFFDEFPFTNLTQSTLRSHLGANLKIYGSDGQLENSSAFNRAKALSIPSYSTLFIFFSEISTNISIHLNSQGQTSTIRMFRNLISEEKNLDGTEKLEVTEVHSLTTTGNLENFVMPDDTGIDFISITSTGGLCDDYILAETSDYIISENNLNLITEDSDASECNLKLYEVCWQTVSEYNFNLSLPSQVEVTNYVEAITGNLSKQVQPIWRPGTIYKIEVITRDQLDGAVYTRPYSFLFRTAGPIGHFHQFSQSFKNLPAPAEEIYPLASLKNYIDYTRSYPNADGNIINAKPLYFANPKLTLFFNSNYVYTMFNPFVPYGSLPKIDSSIEIQIIDPAESKSQEGSVAISYLPANRLPPEVKKWRRAQNPIVPINNQIIGNILGGLELESKNCSGATLPEDAKSVQLGLDIEGFTLQPSKAYMALFSSEYTVGNNPVSSNEVHKYIFQTSKYESFTEHIRSCILEENENEITKRAVFYLENNISGENLEILSEVFNNSTNQPAGLVSSFADPYDRLFDGVLQIETLSPATGTEFNVIINPAGQNFLMFEDEGFILLEDEDGRIALEESGPEIIGVIVRSDEPLADPKIIESSNNTEEKTLKDVLQFRSTNGQYSDSISLFSKDKSNAFISNKWMHLTPGPGYFKFSYILPNGDIYSSLAEEEIVFDLV